MDRLKLIAVGNGKEIRSGCALSITYQQIHFSYEGKYHTIKYNQSRKGNYFILKGIRYYFKVWDSSTNKWIIDCDCF